MQPQTALPLEVAGGICILSPCPQAPYLGFALDNHNTTPLIPKVPLIFHIMVNLLGNLKPFFVWLKV
jgi:hypothetical protein